MPTPPIEGGEKCTKCAVPYSKRDFYSCGFEDETGPHDFSISNLSPRIPTRETLREGDWVGAEGHKRKVLARLNDVLLLSEKLDENKPMFNWVHIKQIRAEGYTIVSSAPVSLSLAEIEERLGYKINLKQ